MGLGQQLRAARIAAGLSQIDVEKATGISNNKISNCEAGIVRITADVLRILCILYGTSADLILDLPTGNTEAFALYEKYQKLSPHLRLVVDLILEGESEI